MEIEKNLNELICKYNIDRHMPAFRKFIRAKILLEDFYRQISDQYRTIILVGSTQTPITWFHRNICKNKAKELLISELDAEFSKDEDTEIASCYIIVSYEYKDELKVKMYDHGKRVKSIYDIFEKQKMYFDRDFYDIYGLIYHDFRTKTPTRDYKDFDINEIFFWHRRNYELELDTDNRKTYLEKIIFDCVYARDFLLLRFYLNKYFIEYTDCEDYKLFFQDVENLLSQIIEYLRMRSQKDCIMIWLDGLEHGDDKNMAFLHELDTRSFVFDNIYTVTPYTGPTFKALFGSMRVVEENAFKVTEISEKNSDFLRGLTERGYQFKYYGHLELLGKKHIPSYFHSIYTVMTQIFWNILCDIVSQKEGEKGFFVLHEILQTHDPYISMGLKGTTYTNRETWPGKQEESEKLLCNKQTQESREYVDKQLEFWDRILPNCMYKIYMSDHGHNFFGRFHPIMKIKQENIVVKRCESLLSYFNFGKIMLHILDHDSLDEDKFGTESVIIQDVDYYYKDYILDYIKQDGFCPDHLIGYQGVITKQDMLISYWHGVEYYQKKVNDGICVTDDRLEYLRSLLSRSRINIYEEDKFKYSRIIWDANLRCTERTLDREEQKKRIIKCIFKNISQNKIVAIRGGGMHTLRLLMMLDNVLRKRVKYIIDQDKLCLAGKIGIEVLKPDELQDVEIDYFVVSSYDFRKQWKEELVQLKSGNVVEIYEELEKAGFVCNKEFYKKDFIKQDFEGLVNCEG